jgi:hypothetical protein
VEQVNQAASEHDKPAQIHLKRGLEHGLASQAADQLVAKDTLGAHAQDELGVSEVTTARPTLAALTSAATFPVGAIAPYRSRDGSGSLTHTSSCCRPSGFSGF